MIGVLKNNLIFEFRDPDELAISLEKYGQSYDSDIIFIVSSTDLIKGIICKGQWTFSPIINEEERYYIYGIPYNKEYISLMRGDKLPVLKNYELGPIPFEFKTQRYPAYIN